jgi:hypothetical protein
MAAANRICVGRLCGDQIKTDGRAIRFMEKQCKAACAAGSDLCGKCMKYETAYMGGDGPLKWHGRFGQANLPEASHIVGSAWNVATRAKEDAKLAKAAAAAVDDMSAAGGAGVAAPAKKAKAAAKKAAAAATEAVATAREAVSDHMAALAGAANAMAGVTPPPAAAVAAVIKKARSATAKAKKVVAPATITKEQAVLALRQVTELMGGLETQRAMALQMQKLLRKEAGVASSSSSSGRRSSSRRRSSSARRRTHRRSSYIYRPASAGSNRAPVRAASRGASPEERSNASRAAIQDKIIADIMAAQAAGAGGGGNLD